MKKMLTVMALALSFSVLAKATNSLAKERKIEACSIAATRANRVTSNRGMNGDIFLNCLKTPATTKTVEFCTQVATLSGAELVGSFRDSDFSNCIQDLSSHIEKEIKLNGSSSEKLDSCLSAGVVSLRMTVAGGLDYSTLKVCVASEALASDIITCTNLSVRAGSNSLQKFDEYFFARCVQSILK